MDQFGHSRIKAHHRDLTRRIQYHTPQHRPSQASITAISSFALNFFLKCYVRNLLQTCGPCSNIGSGRLQWFKDPARLQSNYRPTHRILPWRNFLLVGDQQLFQVVSGADLPQLIFDAPDQLCLLLLTKLSSLATCNRLLSKNIPGTAVCGQSFGKPMVS